MFLFYSSLYLQICTSISRLKVIVLFLFHDCKGRGASVLVGKRSFVFYFIYFMKQNVPLRFQYKCRSSASLGSVVLIVNWRGRKGGWLRHPHPSNDTRAAQLCWDAAQTATNRNHGPGCELGTGCQHRKSKKKALQNNVWNNVRNYPESRVGVSLFTGRWVRETCREHRRLQKESRKYWK